jgi:hypothetical protein
LIIFSPDNSPGDKEPGGAGFPACAKNTPLFWAFQFNQIYQYVIVFFEKFMDKVDCTKLCS